MRAEGWSASGGMLGRRRVRIAAAILSAGCATLLLAACTSPSPRPTRSASASASASSSPRPSASPTATPELVFTGTARQNLPFFDLVNRRLIAAGGTPHGRDFIDNLVASGFVKTDMQGTRDTTTVGLAADNIQFSVLFNGACLIGQYGNIGYASTVQPVLSTGRCLAGDTRPIDW